VSIHPTAIIESGADLAADVVVGAYAYIGPKVRLGAGTVVHHHATVEGNTHLGLGNEVFPYAFVGGRTQDKKWQGDDGPIRIGEGNIFREFCTVHPATFLDAETRIGSRNLFCSYSHIGHECHVGDDCVFSNNATLGGHCLVGSRVVIGGLTAVHQFCQVGDGAMIGGCARVVQDVLPYMIAEGHPAAHRSINKVGMERHGFDAERIQQVRRIYKLLFRSNLNHSQALAQLKEGVCGSGEVVDQVVRFIEASQRGFS
jgi:UDP-N-acetylglucosamine acyltransferase